MESSHHRRARVNLRALVLLLVIGCGIAVTGYVLHKYRVRSSIQRALALGRSAYDAGQYSRAAGELGRYLSRHPEDHETLLLYADAQLRCRPQTQNNLGQAVRALEQILRQQPAHADAAQRLTSLYLRVGDQVDARRIAEAWYLASPGDPAARTCVIRALLAQQKGEDSARALKYVEQWLADDPADRVVLRLKAEVLIARNEHDQARDVLKQLLATRADDVEGARLLAFLIHNRKTASRPGDEDDPEQILSRAVEMNPQSAEARLARGRFYLLTARPDKARTDLEGAVQLGSADANLLLTAGVLLAEAGFSDSAGTAFEQAQKVEPRNPAVYAEHAEALLESGDAEGGLAVADRAWAAPLGEQQLDILGLAAELYAAAGHPAEIRKCLDAQRAVDPRTEPVSYIEGLIAVAEGRLYDAIGRFGLTVQHNPRNARAQLHLARALVRTDSPRRAIGPFKEYIRLRQEAGKPAAAAQLELARVYASLGRPDEAANIVAGISVAGLSQALANSALFSRLELMAETARPGGVKPDPAIIKHMTREVADLARRHPQAVPIRILHAKLTAWQGDLDGAVKALRDLPVGAGDRLAVGTAIIDLLWGAGRHDEAVAECKALANTAQLTQDQACSLKTRLAVLQADAGRTAEARQVLDELIARSEGLARSSARTLLARLLLRDGQTEAAREVLLQVLAEDAGDVTSRLLLLPLDPVPGKGPDRQTLADQLKHIEGEGGIRWRYAQALAYLEPPEVPQDWRTYAHTRAIEALLTECLDKDPDWDAAAFALGTLYERTGEESKARDAYRRALAANPRSVQVARRLAVLAERTQQTDDLDHALRALPADDPLAGRLRLMVAVRQGDRDKAIRLLKEAIANDKEAKDAATRLQLSALLREKGDIQEAQRLAEEAARIAPDSTEVLAARVELCLVRAEFEAALKLCEEAVARQPRADGYRLLAQVHEAKGDFAAAEAALRKVISLDDAAEAGYLALGRLQLRRGHAEKAIESWREGLTVLPASYPLRLALAEALLTGGKRDQMDEAVRILDALIAERPDDLSALLMRADYLHHTDPAKGEAELDRLESQNRDLPAVVRRRIQFAIRNMQAAEAEGLGAKARAERSRALDLADRLLRGSPRDAGLLLLKSGLLVNDNPAAAAAAARQAMDIRPGSEAPILAYIRAVLSRTPPSTIEVREALKAGEAFLARPDTARAVEARLAMADLCMGLAAQEPAVRRRADELIGQAAVLAPQSPLPVLARLRWQAASREWDKVVSTARAWLQTSDTDPAVAVAAGQLLLESGDPKWQEAAIDMFRQALNRRPADAQSFISLAMAHLRLNRYDDAQAAIRQGLGALGQQAALLAALGSVHYQAGQYEEAVAAYRHCLAVGPDNYRVVNDLAYVLCENLKQPAEAEKLAGKAIQAGVDDPSLWDTWGVILYRLGRHSESQRAFERALGNPRIRTSTRQSATFHLGRLLMAVDPARGRELLDRLVSTPPAERLISPADFAEAQALLAGISASRPSADSSAATRHADGPVR